MNQDRDDLDALNDTLDAAVGRRVGASPPEDFRVLLSADERTPDPDPYFAQALRARLLQERRAQDAPDRLESHLGIVATLVPFEQVHFRRVTTSCAVAAAVLLALFAFNVDWSDGGRQAFGVPTAVASVTATPTPVPVSTVQSEGTDLSVPDAG